MWPYVASAAVSSLNHAVTAVRMLLSDIRHCLTPHDVDAHGVPSNTLLRLTPSPTHQPRSWSKAEAP